MKNCRSYPNKNDIVKLQYVETSGTQFIREQFKL